MLFRSQHADDHASHDQFAIALGRVEQRLLLIRRFGDRHRRRCGLRSDCGAGLRGSALFCVGHHEFLPAADTGNAPSGERIIELDAVLAGRATKFNHNRHSQGPKAAVNSTARCLFVSIPEFAEKWESLCGRSAAG